MMKKLALKSLITLLFLFTFTLCHAQPNNWKARIEKGEWQITQLTRKTDVMYEMVKALFIKRFGEKAYEKLLWKERKE